jgi:hypothetical protein
MEKFSSCSEQLWRSFTNSSLLDDGVGEQAEASKPANSVSKQLAYNLVEETADAAGSWAD